MAIAEDVPLFPFAGCAQGYRDRSLHGCYGGLAVGEFLPAPISPPQNAAVMLLNFDGTGGFKGAYTGTWQNAIVNRSFTGTYTVAADGTGTLKWQYTKGGGGESFSFVLVSGGQEVFCLYTTNHAPQVPYVQTMTLKKQ